VGWNAVRDMSAAGVTFGSHTASHADLTRVPRTRVEEDLERSRRAIADVTGRAVRTLSYPFGRYNDATRDAARAAGFDAAFSLYPSHSNARIDRYALRREPRSRRNSRRTRSTDSRK
jgi:peptidoglycan/xylan/chitin deacetylase (PgdA/CDA1 family)